MARVVPSQVVQFIDRVFPFAASEPSVAPPVLDGGAAGDLQGLLDLVENVPAELIIAGELEFAQFTVAAATLRVAQRHWPSATPSSRYRVPLVDNRTPVAVIRSVLTKCPDELPAVSTAELSYLKDEGLRAGLRTDIGAIERALANGEWKAATVLAGSVVEALLLWAIQQQGEAAWSSAAAARAKTAPRAKSDPISWHLHEYIEIAEELRVILKDTAIQARLAKDFRNLIHPGREQRLGQKCERGSAYGAVAALHLVVRDLSR